MWRQRLTKLMFDMVVPGGRVLVANFAPVLPEVGYMETFMAWKLIYRTPEEMGRLSSDIPGSQWSSHACSGTRARTSCSWTS